MNSFSDEDLSELAEALQDACQTTFVSASDRREHCPLGAMFTPNISRRPCSPRLMPWLPREIAVGFASGFDGRLSEQNCFIDMRAFDLGVLFRKQFP